MRIHGNRPQADEVAQKAAVEKASVDSRRGTPGAAGGSGDRVALSGDAALAIAAVKALDDAPGVRAEVVERMQRLLAAGELGEDVDGLADSLIDSMAGGK